ncbi:ISAs1 family transposase [Niveibacterium sp. 24ML]|nr:ISAs1 family transposase [Niveibacterium sp. 24ML]MCX9156172.1 ISAs1 family transposase [Niveibacterium sp. 24ML]
MALHQIARQIRQRGADHLLAVNGNQPRLREPLEDAFADQPDTVARESNTTGHGRQTQQIAQVLSNTGHVDAQRGTDYRSRGRVLSLRIVNGQARRIEQRYYISSAELDTESCAGMVPRHWAVENDLHWRLDVALREDAWVVRRDHAPENPKHCCATHIRSIRTTPTGGRTRPSPLG